MIKLIAFDLDDTLAELGEGIARENLKKLSALEERGIRIALCSGKPVEYLCGFMRQAGLARPVLVGENGAVIQIGVDLPPREFYVQEYSVEARQCILELREKITEALPAIWYQPNLVGLTPFPVGEEEFRIVQEILSGYEPERRGLAVYRHVDSFDIVPGEIDKKRGMELLGRVLSVTPDEVIAVGNAENDYPMFEYAGLAVGVHVPDRARVDFNFPTPEAALDFLLTYTAGET